MVFVGVTGHKPANQITAGFVFTFNLPIAITLAFQKHLTFEDQLLVTWESEEAAISQRKLILW